nr:hypothetical protein [Tanacetum cinerariifolium]
GKEIVITESSVRRDLQLADAEGIDCLPKSTIFEQLALIGKPTIKDTQVPQPSGLTEFITDEAVHKELGDNLVRAATTTSSLGAEHDSGNITKTQSKATPNESSSQGTNSGGGLRVLDLEKTKTTQFNKIASLKRRVKKLENRNRHDEKDAKKFQAKFDKEERLTREKAKKEKRVNIALIETWDDIQAKIDDDHQLAKRLQEQEELFDAEKATLFQQLLKKRRKHFAAKREEEKKNKPPTKSQ